MRENSFYSSPRFDEVEFTINKFPLRRDVDFLLMMSDGMTERAANVDPRYLDRVPLTQDEVQILRKEFPTFNPFSIPWHVVREWWLSIGFTEQELEEQHATHVISMLATTRPTRAKKSTPWFQPFPYRYLLSEFRWEAIKRVQQFQRAIQEDRRKPHYPPPCRLKRILPRREDPDDVLRKCRDAVCDLLRNQAQLSNVHDDIKFVIFQLYHEVGKIQMRAKEMCRWIEWGTALVKERPYPIDIGPFEDFGYYLESLDAFFPFIDSWPDGPDLDTGAKFTFSVEQSVVDSKETDTRCLVTVSQIARVIGYGRNSMSDYKAAWGQPQVPDKGSRPAYFNMLKILPILVRQFPEFEQRLTDFANELMRNA